MTNSRYPLANYTLPHLIPFIEEILQISVNPDEMTTEKETQDVPTSHTKERLVTTLNKAINADRVSLDNKKQLIHSHRQLSVDEIYRLLYIDSLTRMVDLVLYPKCEEHVNTIVHLTSECDLCLVPYNGSTNVSDALILPTDDGRIFTSINIKQMNKIAWLNEENLQAYVETKISNKKLKHELSTHKYTSGHDPDNIKLSTLNK